MTFGAVVYGLVSCWMYVIGMGAAIFTGESDIAQIMVKAGLGIAGAILFPMDDITDFLYFIGSVFAPMIAIQIADFFILKKAESKRAFEWKTLVVWLLKKRNRRKESSIPLFICLSAW